MSKEKSKKVTVRFSYQLKKAMEKEILEQGRRAHGKSKWVAEAIENFATQSQVHDLIENGTKINQGELERIEAFYLPQSTILKLKGLILAARRQDPLLEGVQSSIIRASVVNKLIHK